MLFIILSVFIYADGMCETGNMLLKELRIYGYKNMNIVCCIATTNQQ